jgi:hypothetical protein
MFLFCSLIHSVMVTLELSFCGPWSFTPIHSLTGSEGQLFASRPGGQWFVSQKCTHTYNGTGFSCLRCLLPGPRSDQSPASTSLGWFTRVCTDSRRDHTSHASLVPFCSLQVLLLLATQWLVRALFKLLGGGEPCGGYVVSLQYTVSLVQWVKYVLPPRGAAVCIPGMHPHLQWNWVLLLAMSRYKFLVGRDLQLCVMNVYCASLFLCFLFCWINHPNILLRFCW